MYGKLMNAKKKKKNVKYFSQYLTIKRSKSQKSKCGRFSGGYIYIKGGILN